MTPITAVDHASIKKVTDGIDLFPRTQPLLTWQRSDKLHTGLLERRIWEEIIIRRNKNGKTSNVDLGRITGGTIQKGTSGTSVGWSQVEVVVNELPPLHHRQGKVSVEIVLTFVDILRNYSWIRERSPVNWIKVTL